MRVALPSDFMAESRGMSISNRCVGLPPWPVVVRDEPLCNDRARRRQTGRFFGYPKSNAAESANRVAGPCHGSAQGRSAVRQHGRLQTSENRNLALHLSALQALAATGESICHGFGTPFSTSSSGCFSDASLMLTNMVDFERRAILEMTTQ